MRRVIKFGGTSIATPELVRTAARRVARLVEYGDQVAVVVSAPGNATSELLAAIHDATESDTNYLECCEFAALGEEQSVRLMVAALRSCGVRAQAFLPREPETWPLIADSEDESPLPAAKVNEERPFILRTQQTNGRFRRYVLPQLRVGAVPVISGFFALSTAGKIISLGRGGSDITAFIVANHISADELVIVTDVSGVLSADPRLADNPSLLQELSYEDMQVISNSGARVLHPRALKFKDEFLKVRLMDYRELEDLESTGTSILGKSDTVLFRNPDELSMITLVGEAEQLEAIADIVMAWRRKFNVIQVAASSSKRFICNYVPTEVADEAYRGLHDLLKKNSHELTSLSIKGGIGELRLRSAKFIDEPGVLAEVTGILANARINIVEVITGLTDISLFLAYQDLDTAENLLGRLIEDYSG